MAEAHHSQSAGSQRIGRVLVYAALILFALYYLMPLFVMVVTSLKSLDEIRAGNLLALPLAPTVEAWTKAWGSACTGVRTSSFPAIASRSDPPER